MIKDSLQFIRYLFIIVIILVLSNCKSKSSVVSLHYLGHSSFVFSYDNGVDIVTDYGKDNAWLEWGWDSPIYDIGSLIPEVMTFSHQHDDHYDPDRIPEGVLHVLFQNDSLTIEGIEIHSVQTCESDLNEYSNSSFIFEYKDMKICHLGDAQIQIMNIL